VATRDKIAQVFINPIIEDSVRALDILVHEMIHVAYPTSGHKGDFKKAALKVGLTGKMTATVAGPELKVWLEKITQENLGVYPHAQIMLSSRKKQTTRLIKQVCNDCGYVVRSAKTWIDCAGPVICPCNNEVMSIE
jgi:hypothetical protein